MRKCLVFVLVLSAFLHAEVQVALPELEAWVSKDPDDVGNLIWGDFIATGVDVNYQIVPIARAIDGVITGKYDCIYGADMDQVAVYTKLPMLMSSIIISSKWSIYSLKPTVPFQLQQDTSMLILGVPLGLALDERQLGVRVDQFRQVVQVRESASLLLMVQNGRVDFAILDDRFVEKYGVTNLQKGVTGDPVVADRRLLCNANVVGTRELIRRFNEFLEQRQAL